MQFVFFFFFGEGKGRDGIGLYWIWYAMSFCFVLFCARKRGGRGELRASRFLCDGLWLYSNILAILKPRSFSLISTLACVALVWFKTPQHPWKTFDFSRVI